MAMPSIDPSAFGTPLGGVPTGFTMPAPDPSQIGGMFGGGPSWQNALMAAAAGFNARRSPGLANSMMEQLTQKQVLNRQAQLAMLRDNLEFQRQLQLLPIEAQLKLQYPSDEFSQSLYQSGARPGTPEWAAAQGQHVQVTNNPVVMTPYGPMRYSDVANSQPQILPSLPPGAKPLPEPGGPTPSASGGFY